MKQLTKGMYLEFPVANQHYVGHKNKYTYMSYRDESNTEPISKKAQDNLNHEGFIKYDLQKEQIVSKVSFGHTHAGGEVFYQQRDNSDPLSKEDDGYIMTVVHDWSNKQSQFRMWDSRKLGGPIYSFNKPVLIAPLKERVPFGFHTTFIG